MSKKKGAWGFVNKLKGVNHQDDDLDLSRRGSGSNKNLISFTPLIPTDGSLNLKPIEKVEDNSVEFPKETEEIVIGIEASDESKAQLNVRGYDSFMYLIEELQDSMDGTKGISFNVVSVVPKGKDKSQVQIQLSQQTRFKHIIIKVQEGRGISNPITTRMYDAKSGKLLDSSTIETKIYDRTWYTYYIFYHHAKDCWKYKRINEPPPTKTPGTSGTTTPKEQNLTKNSRKESIFVKKSDPNLRRESLTDQTVEVPELLPVQNITPPKYLNIKLIGGYDLAVCDLNGFSDPYAVVFLGNDKLKTSIQYKTLNPVWEQQLDFLLPGHYIEDLKIEVWDYDLGKSHDFMGQYTIKLSDIELRKNYKIELQKRPKKKDSHVKGEIEFLFDIDQMQPIEARKLNIFGIDLVQVMERRNEFENIPRQIKSIVDFLMKNAPATDGIFRIAAPSEFRDKWSKLMDAGELLPLSGSNKEDLTHNVASVFKLYIRELPNPLLTYELYDEFLKSVKIEDRKERLESYAKLLTEIPNDFREMIKELLTLCNLIAAKSDSNRMTPTNLAVVFGIGILRTKDDMRNVQDVNQIQKVYIDLMEMHPNHFIRAQQIIDEEEAEEEEEEEEEEDKTSEDRNVEKMKSLLKLKQQLGKKSPTPSDDVFDSKQETKQEENEPSFEIKEIKEEIKEEVKEIIEDINDDIEEVEKEEDIQEVIEGVIDGIIDKVSEKIEATEELKKEIHKEIKEEIIDEIQNENEKIEQIQCEETLNLLPNKHETSSHYLLWWSMSLKRANIKKVDEKSIIVTITQDDDLTSTFREISEFGIDFNELQNSFIKKKINAKFTFKQEIDEIKEIQKENWFGIMIKKK
eukprot:gene792-9042_t